ncbi:MAG: HlyD family secretion protein [Arenicellales bacterium]
MKRIMKWGAVVVSALAVAGGGYWYYRNSLYYPSTNDAYVKATVIKVTPQVGGQVVSAPISDQQRVGKGQLLFQIDKTPFDLKVDAAEASLALARQQVRAQDAAVAAAKATVSDREAQLTNARIQYKRARILAAKQAGSQAKLDDARAGLDRAQAALSLAKARLHQATVQRGEPGDRNQQVRKAKAALDQAKLDLEHTSAKAPCAGQVSGVSLNPGDVVTSKSPEFSLVCSNRYWVYANYKETDLPRIRPGQKATIAVDMYPNHTFHGIVESVNPASGTAFSLLPPENATGNWVKVTQRVPVRILVVDARADYPLRVQTSTEVTIDTGTGSEPLGKARGDGLTDSEAMALARHEGLLMARQ